MEIDINKTPLSEENYTEFMKVLDTEILKQCPAVFNENYRHSETIYKHEWLADSTGCTVQDLIDYEIESFD